MLLAAAPSRVITVSSGGMYYSSASISATLQLPGLEGDKGPTAYARAKRAQGGAQPGQPPPADGGTGVAFHAMRPGWLDTPGSPPALPGLPAFTTRPRSCSPRPSRGRDTIVRLATAAPGRLDSGLLWHDRQVPGPEYPLLGTRERSRTPRASLGPAPGTEGA